MKSTARARLRNDTRCWAEPETRRPRTPHPSRYQFARAPMSVSQPLRSAFILLETAATRGRWTTGMTAWLPQARSFMRMNIAARLTRRARRLGCRVELVVLFAGPAGDVAALPLVLLGRDFRTLELLHERRGIGLRHSSVVHLDVAVELRIGIGVGDVGREEHRRGHRLELELDAGLLAGLLDDRLGLLPRRVDRCLKHELQLLAVLGADAVRSFLPAGGLEDLVGLVDVELPLRVLRNGSVPGC